MCRKWILANGCTIRQSKIVHVDFAVKIGRLLKFSLPFLSFSFRSENLKLVVPLPYDSKNWNPREVIKMLGKFSKIEMDNVIWQLGEGEQLEMLNLTNSSNIIITSIYSK